MKVRSRAPLRLGMAGGGTDLSPYCDEFGGFVLNATINLFAHTSLEIIDGECCEFIASDLGVTDSIILDHVGNITEGLALHRAVYARVMRDFNNGQKIPVRVSTYCDAPPGSGLGSSSTMVVAMLEAYRHLLSLPLGEYDVARLAFQIERIDCNLSGGKQDQYAAAFGGFNFMEFYEQGRVVVNPLRIRRHIQSELELHTILFFTGKSRDSAKIIDEQIKAVRLSKNSLQGMHEVKATAKNIKEKLLSGDIYGLTVDLRSAWNSKKSTSSSISNDRIQYMEGRIMQAGATSLKISGAGGGGFLMIFVDPEKRLNVLEALKSLDGTVIPFQFVNEGAYSWMP